MVALLTIATTAPTVVAEWEEVQNELMPIY